VSVCDCDCECATDFHFAIAVHSLSGRQPLLVTYKAWRIDMSGIVVRIFNSKSLSFLYYIVFIKQARPREEKNSPHQRTPSLFVYLTGNQHKSRQVQKATGINVGREQNKSRYAIGTKVGISLIIISANREHQAQENVYTYFFIYFGTSHWGFGKLYLSP